MRQFYFSSFLSTKCDCEKCSERDKVAKGCKNDGMLQYVDYDGEMIRRCPASLESYDNYRAIKLYVAYDKHGVLPNNGGLYDNSAIFNDTLDVMGIAMAQEKYTW